MASHKSFEISHDVPEKEFLTRVSETVSLEGFAVMTDLLPMDDADRIRSEVRRKLIPTIPLRALRYGAEGLLGRSHTPDFLQRRPYEMHRADTHRHFSAETERVLDSIDELNEELLATQALARRFQGRRHRISRVVLNRFAPHEEFEPHQDGIENTGLSFVIQTSPTLWSIHPEGPRAGKVRRSFIAEAGSVVVLTQSIDGLQQTDRHRGFSDFSEDGSVVHSGVNLTNRNRFTLALFSSPA